MQRDFVATHDGVWPLQMVPTEYYNHTESAYKRALRETLDPEVEVMWTGVGVVPDGITNEDAEQAAKVFGRKVFVWDNYPVNDFGNTSGRLLLAPYDKREAGLSDHLSGVVANPMNQPYASKVAVFGTADFAWNDRAYDADRTWRQALSYLAGGDPKATEALLTFADLEHLAPTFGATPGSRRRPNSPGASGRSGRSGTTVTAPARSGHCALTRPRSNARRPPSAPAPCRRASPSTRRPGWTPPSCGAGRRSG